MVSIRLTRTGAKKKPTYRVIVTDKRRARDSKSLEIVGHYDPRPTPIHVDLKRDRIDHWLSVGAKPSETVQRLIKFFDEHGPNLPEAQRAKMQEEAAAKPARPRPTKEEAAAKEAAETKETAEPKEEAAEEKETAEAAAESSDEKPEAKAEEAAEPAEKEESEKAKSE